MISGAFSLIKNFKRQRPNTAAFLCSVFGTVAPCQIVFLALCSVLCRFLEFSGVALAGSSLLFHVLCVLIMSVHRCLQFKTQHFCIDGW